MTRRRTVLALALGGICLVAAAAILGATGSSSWRLKALAIGAAIALFGAGIIQTLVTAALDRRRQGASPDRGMFMPGGKLPRVRTLDNPVVAGVRAAERSAGADGSRRALPPYVPRDIDPVLRQALADSGLILLVGAAAAGKTRTGYEAIRAVLPDHVFIAPADAGNMPAALSAAGALRDCVLWLDDIQRYLGASALTSQAIAGLLGGAQHHRIVLGTLRATEESRLIALAGTLSGEQLTRDGQAILDLASTRIVVDRTFSAAERSRAEALAAGDSRLGDALRRAGRYGVPEYLSSGPRLLTEWDNSWEPGAHPRGAALVAVAVDCRRAGFAAPLPQVLLEELGQQYLEQRGGMILRPEPLADAWTWATGPRDAGSTLLWPVSDGCYDVFDYLVDVLAREPAQPVPESTAHAALRHARPADAMTIAATAWYQQRPELAEAGFRSAYTELSSTEGPESPATLASRSDLAVTLSALGRLPDAEAEYRAILALRSATIGPDHPETLASHSNLAVVLQNRGRLDEAEAEYRAVLDLRTRKLGEGHPSTLVTRNNLGVLLWERRRLADAEAELTEVVRLRSLVLGPEHPNTQVSRRNLEGVRRLRSSG